MKSYTFLFFLFIFLVSIIAGVIYFVIIEIQKILNQEENITIPYKEIELEPYIPFQTEINKDKG